MNLRQKLLTTFGGLALLTLVTAGMTTWTLHKWRNSEKRLDEHYQRSLLVKEVQAATFRAFKELPDSVTGGDQDAREEFEELIAVTTPDFQQWTALAHNDQERQQVQQVRNSYETLLKEAYRVFDLVDTGRYKEALILLDDYVEEGVLEEFEKVTEAAIESDRQNRRVIRTQVQNARRTAQLALSIVAFGTISLVLLLAGYLASDLFTPLREVKLALDDAKRGNWQRRLDEERTDEFGAIAQAYNQMLEEMASRQQVVEFAAIPMSDLKKDSHWQKMSSRVMLHQMVSQLRSRVANLSHDNTIEDKKALIAQLDLLLQAVSRIAEFGFPLDLNLARTDIRILVYEVLQRFQPELIERAVSIEIDIDPAVNYAVVDRLKLRSALDELIRNALNALPEEGGRLGMRTTVSEDGTELKLEVGDNGKGIKQRLIEQAFTPLTSENGKTAGVGLALTKAIIQQHGGEITLKSEPEQGTYVQIVLPINFGNDRNLTEARV
ncbi:HAMP domain-containing histidine kinase [Mastigocladus laminosus UU774]|nr:HAMP domain-containing histidine kinase [Mastigocladus laminosus UU774]